ncbi:MAG: hypothetical protein EOP05_18325, partial [Proteobacteria bacterium]
MKKLMLAELRSQLNSIWLLLIGSLLLGYLTFPILYLLAPAGLTLYAHFRARRSHWYLQLPWSRKQIAGLVGLQIFSMFALLSALFIAAYFFSIKPGTARSYIETDFLIFAMYSPFLIFAGLNPLSGVPRVVRSMGLKFDRIFLKTLAVTIGSGLLFFAALALSEMFVYVTIALFAPFLLALTFSNKMVLAPNSNRRVARVSLVAAPLVVALPFSLSIYFLYSAPAASDRTTLAVEYLGNIPVPISEERALELFNHTSVGRAAMVKSHLPALQAKASLADWKARTEKCEDSSCQQLSSEVAPPSRLPASEV